MKIYLTKKIDYFELKKDYHCPNFNWIVDFFNHKSNNNYVIGASNYEIPLIEKNKYNIQSNIHIEDELYKDFLPNFRYLKFVYIRNLFNNNVNDSSSLHNNNNHEVYPNISIDLNEYINQYVREIQIRGIHLKNILELELYNIQIIKINFCNLKVFPTRKISTYCHTLDLSNNQIEGELYLEHTNCKFIHLDNNKISTIYLPYQCNTISMNSNCLLECELYNPVMKASFCNNKITKFKISKWMEECSMTNNHITNIENLDKCEKLHFLNMSYNELTNLDISKNILLKKLYCKSNKIENLDGICDCKNLEVLDLSFNKIELFEIPLNISRVDLTNNPLKIWEYNYFYKNESNLTSNLGNMIFSYLMKSKITSCSKNILNDNDNSNQNSKKIVNIYLNLIEAEEFSNIFVKEYLDICINNNIVINIHYRNNEYIEIGNSSNDCKQYIFDRHFIKNVDKYSDYIKIKLDKSQFHDWLNKGDSEKCIFLYRNNIISFI